MALRAPPISGLSLAYSCSSPSSFSANRPCMFMLPPHKSSFLGNGGEALKVTELRLAYSDRLRCNGHGGGINLFARAVRIVKSYTDAILSYFEDPEKILEQAVRDMNDDLAQLRQATASVLATQKKLEVKYKDAQQASEDWYQKAQLALARGDEGLAHEALIRRKKFFDHNSFLKAQLDQQLGMVDSLVSKTQLLERKIQEANLKKDALQARAAAAKTAKKVQEMVGTAGTSSALCAFGRIEEKVLIMESMAEAIHQLTTDDLDAKFKMLEACSVEDEFAELKREVSMSSKSKIGELPPGRDAIPLDRVLPL